MALVANCDSDLRIYKRSLGSNLPSRQEKDVCRSGLLRKINTFYSKALRPLKGRLRRRVVARFLDGDGSGLCLGLLDPVSNILANALTPYSRYPTSTTREQRRRGKRDERSVAGDERSVAGDVLEIMAKRSLDGLLGFLTRFFPFLADSQALLYLYIADGDLLVAVRIAVSDLGMKRFGSSVPAVKDALRAALKCGALAAGHRDPDRLVGAWFTISCRLHKAVDLLRELGHSGSTSSADKLVRLLLDGSRVWDGCGCEDDDLWLLWQRAASRRHCPSSVPFKFTNFLKRTFQDVIHGFYLQALARMPAGELRSRFHRSLLKAGHCYGPLDPVSNIILNTIWYDAMFPPTVKLEMDLICTLSLHQIENRSLYGLASFLSTRYHRIGFHQAVRCLLQADANLLIADPNLDPEGTPDSLRLELQTTLRAFRAAGFCDVMNGVDRLVQGHPDTSVEKAFLAAATAGYHPNPDAQAKFLASCKPMLGSFLLLLQSGDQLSSEDVQLLAGRMLYPESRCDKPLLPFPIKSPFVIELLHKHARILKKVASVLNRMPNGDMYEVKVVCGVNDEVSGPVHSLNSGSFAPYKWHRSHINFFATHKIAGGAPELFFAELSNGDKDEAELQSFCCPVLTPSPCAERVRCLYCDYVGIRIVHPIQEEFHGREWEFERMACGKDPTTGKFDPTRMVPFHTNMSIINNSSLVADRVYARLKEDDFYDEDSYGNKSDDDGGQGCEDGDLELMSDDDFPAWAFAFVTSSSIF